MKLFGKYKRKNILYFLSVLIVGIFIVLVVRFTYAFFVGRVNEAAGNVQVGTDTVDDLDFAVGNPLSIDATPTTLPENGANLTSSTTATATLTANSTNSQATYNYYVYLNIPSNTLVYSDGSTPEVILTVTDPSGNNVTNIEGLTYGTFSGIAGFDVTTVSGAFAVANNYAITSSSSTSATTQNWTFTLTYINHSFDQSINFGNSMSVEIILTREERIPTLSDVCISGGNLANCIKQYNITYGDGVGGLYYHDGVGDYENATEESGDNSYRYSGANPNNYVCFGSDEETCSNDNLYRIIGVFGDQVKLIKRDYANSNMLGTNGGYYGNYGSLGSYYKGSHSAVNAYYWNNSTTVNTWSQSNLNTVNLNTNYINYLNGINSKWNDMIETHTWKVGGNTYQNIYYNTTVKNTYRNEIVSPAANTTYSAKIGLMYVSDYGYAASPANWTTILGYGGYNSDTNRNNNWMFMGLYEWTISRYSGSTYFAFLVIDIGYVGDDGSGYLGDGFGVRPSFYLKSGVAITSGDGSSSNPYRLSLNSGQF